MRQLARILCFSFVVHSVHGHILVDNFNTGGALAGSTPQTGNAWQSSGGSGTLSKQNGFLTIDSSVSQKVESLFPAFSSGTIYAGLTFEITTAPVTSWIFPFTFRGLNASGGDQVGRVFITKGSSATSYKIGIDNNMDNPVWWPVELQQGDEHRIVLGFTENGSLDFTRFWLDPTSAGSAFIAEPAENLTAEVFGFRFNAFNNTIGDLTVDDLIITTDFFAAAAIPEPSTLLLLVFPLLAAARRKQRTPTSRRNPDA